MQVKAYILRTMHRPALKVTLETTTLCPTVAQTHVRHTSACLFSLSSFSRCSFASRRAFSSSALFLFSWTKTSKRFSFDYLTWTQQNYVIFLTNHNGRVSNEPIWTHIKKRLVVELGREKAYGQVRIGWLLNLTDGVVNGIPPHIKEF